uniref:Uncharacterized protein n=1 Tax=Megaselia scalaris TaxID=36166 RepID=T1GJP4_MEGSC
MVLIREICLMTSKSQESVSFECPSLQVLKPQKIQIPLTKFKPNEPTLTNNDAGKTAYGGIRSCKGCRGRQF